MTIRQKARGEVFEMLVDAFSEAGRSGLQYDPTFVAYRAFNNISQELLNEAEMDIVDVVERILKIIEVSK